MLQHQRCQRLPAQGERRRHEVVPILRTRHPRHPGLRGAHRVVVRHGGHQARVQCSTELRPTLTHTHRQAFHAAGSYSPGIYLCRRTLMWCAFFGPVHEGDVI